MDIATVLPRFGPEVFSCVIFLLWILTSLFFKSFDCAFFFSRGSSPQDVTWFHSLDVPFNGSTSKVPPSFPHGGPRGRCTLVRAPFAWRCSRQGTSICGRYGFVRLRGQTLSDFLRSLGMLFSELSPAGSPFGFPSVPVIYSRKTVCPQLSPAGGSLLGVIPGR